MKIINASACVILIALLASFSIVAQTSDVTKVKCVAGDKFHKAAAKGDTEFLQDCLDAGTPVDSLEGNGWTALHAAVFNGKDEAAKLLLKSGAVATVKNNNGKTPLDLVDSKKYPAVAKVLSTSSDAKAESISLSDEKAEKLAEALRFELNNYGPNSSSDSIDYQVEEILSIEKSESDSAAGYVITVKFKVVTDGDGTGNTVVYRGVLSESADGHLSVAEYKFVEA